MEKKIAIITQAYKEEELITACIEQFKPFGLRHLVLVSAKPWNGRTPRGEDFTATLAKRAGAEVHIQYWKNEVEQRNWGLAYLYDYDYVLIIDSDEFFTQRDIQKMIDVLNNTDEPCYRSPKIKTYWKTPEYQFSPGDKHEPIIAVNPKKCKFYDCRQLAKIDDNVPEMYQPIMPIQMHHFSWVRNDERVDEKIEIFNDIVDIKTYWYKNIWKGWDNNKDMENIRPYGIEKSKIIKESAPLEIIQLYNQSINAYKKLYI